VFLLVFKITPPTTKSMPSSRRPALSIDMVIGHGYLEN